MFWSSKKEQPLPEWIPDTTDTIYLNREGTSFFELDCNPFLYAQGLSSIRTILANWIKEDRAIAKSTALSDEGTVSYLLNTIDVKMIPHAIYLEQLLNIIKDNSITHGGSRLLDTITLIHTVVPTEVIRCFKGRFLYGVLYGVSNVDGILPTKEMWINALKVVPWIPFIVLIQEILSLEALGDVATSAIAGTEQLSTNAIAQQ